MTESLQNHIHHTVLTCRVNSYLMLTDVMLRIMSPEHMYLYLDKMNVMQKMIGKDIVSIALCECNSLEICILFNIACFSVPSMIGT